jgi:hypothetical protein
MSTYAAAAQHHALAGVARARQLRGCAMPATASWSTVSPIALVTVNGTDPKPRPRPLVSSQ